VKIVITSFVIAIYACISVAAVSFRRPPTNRSYPDEKSITAACTTAFNTEPFKISYATISQMRCAIIIIFNVRQKQEKCWILRGAFFKAW
jgi:hypothetical protein